QKQPSFIHYDTGSKVAALFSGSLYKLLNRSLTVFRIRKLIKARSPDIIYMRECIWFPFIQRLFAGNLPVVLEINTLLEKELRHFGFFQRILYRFFQRSIYTRVTGIVGVTNEIVDYYAIYQKSSVAIPNGYDFSNAVQETNDEDKTIEGEKSNRRPALLFIGS